MLLLYVAVHIDGDTFQRGILQFGMENFPSVPQSLPDI